MARGGHNRHAGTYLEDAEDEEEEGLSEVPAPFPQAGHGRSYIEDRTKQRADATSDLGLPPSSHLSDRRKTEHEKASDFEGSSTHWPSGPPSRSRDPSKGHTAKQHEPVAARSNDGQYTPTRRPSKPRSRSRPRSERDSEEEEQGLNELVAPAPVEDDDSSGKWRRNETLESAKHGLKTEQEDEKDANRGSEFATQFYIISELVFFSILGTLARLGTQWLTFYPGAPTALSNLWANFGGTLVMGFLQEDRKMFAEEWRCDGRRAHELRPRAEVDKHRRGSPEARAAHPKTMKTMPLYIGLTVGFCGSYTSFSSFQRDVFYGLANRLPSPLNHPTISPTISPSTTVPRNNGYSLAAVLAIIILTLSACYAALLSGAALAKALDRYTPILPIRFLRHFLEPLFVFLAWGCWLGAIILAIFSPDRPGGPSSRGSWSQEAWRGEVLFALVFSPLGCLLRFWLSLKLNGLLAWFPLGTFTANMFGTAVLSVCLDLQHVALDPAGRAIGGGLVGCQVLQGIEDGFCGTLTTVSTWIVEIRGLRSRHAWFYAASSVAMGLAFTVVIMGSVLWSIGWQPISCVVSNEA